MYSLGVSMFLTNMLASFLPESWRGKLRPTASAALASAILQSVLSVAFLIAGYVSFARGSFPAHDPVAAQKLAEHGETAVMGTGIFALFIYLCQPLSMLLTYLWLEGMVRLVAAAIPGEVVATMPLALAAFLVGRYKGFKAERELGAKIPDEMEWLRSSDVVLRVHSCRPKDWNPRITIYYQEVLYELAGQSAGEPPHRFCYDLRLKPENKIARSIREYDPDEVLRESKYK